MEKSADQNKDTNYQKTKITKKRINFIDTWRGLAIVFMVVYHLLYDLKFIFLKDMEFFTISSWYPFQQFICWSFIFLAGFSHKLSKRSLKNSIKILLAALALTFVTKIFDPSAYIRFGVLHLLGTSMLITALGQRLFSLKKINPLVLGLLTFIIFIYFWAYGVETLSFYDDLASRGFLFALGFTGPGFVSTDYFPLVPWFFLYLTGFYLGSYHEQVNPFLRDHDLGENFLEKIGRHSFLIYLIHQPITLGTLYLLQALKLI